MLLLNKRTASEGGIRTCLGKMEHVYLLLCLLLLIIPTAFSECRDPPGNNGDLRVIGVNCTGGAAGRIEICVGMEWRAVCDENWGQNDATVVCNQLGFQGTGIAVNKKVRSSVIFNSPAVYTCRDSCFGQNTNLKGITNFMCQEQPGRLIECDHEEIADSCTAEAGVICGKTTNSIVITCIYIIVHMHADSISCLRTIIADTPGPQTCDCSDMTCPTSTPSPPTASLATLPSTSTTPQNNSTPLCDCTDLPSNFTRATVLPGTSGEGQQTRTDSSIVIGGGLGALAVVLALTLVGVVLGWVWHCHRNKGDKRR